MKIQACLPAAIVAMLLLLVACGNLSVAPEPANPATSDEPITALARGIVVDDGILLIGGDDTANEIHITYSHEGIRVQFDGQEELFREPIQTIVLDAGHGDNVFSYYQRVVTDIDLSILTGAGDDRVDVLFELVDVVDDPSRTLVPPAIDVRVYVDIGEGSDVFGFRLDSTALPALNAYAKLTANGTALGPEIADEVLVTFEHGDPDQPIVLGMVYNGQGANRDAREGAGAHSFVLEKSFTPSTVDVDLQFRGSTGDDELELHADYAGVRLQQGRVILDADFNEGDNHFGGYIVSSARHMHVASTVVAGDGNNEIGLTAHELTHTVQQRSGTTNGTSNTVMVSEVDLGHGNNIVQLNSTDFDFVQHHLELGDGDNHTHIQFGDGVQGRRPPTSQSTVNATYRSGAGSDSIVVEGEANSPVAAEFVLEPGGKNNQVHGRYVFGDWSTSVIPGAPKHPLHVKIHLGEPVDELNFTIEEQPPADAPGRPAEFVVIAIGQKTRGTLDYLKTIGDPALPAGSDLEFKYVPVRRTFTFGDLSADELSFMMVHGDNRVNKTMRDVMLKRGLTESNGIAIEELAIAQEGFNVELEGLEVFGSFTLAKETQTGVSSSTVLRDVHVHQSATSYFEGIRIFDISDIDNPALPVNAPKDGTIAIRGKDITVNSLLLQNLRVDGTFNTTVRTGDTSFEMALGEATVGYSDILIWGITGPANPRSAATEYPHITVSDVLVSGWYNISLETGNPAGLVSYTQDRVVIEPGANMDVSLDGSDGTDVLLALLRGITTAGDSSYSFTAYGGDGDDLIAVLAQELNPAAEGSTSFEVRGDERNDTLALAVLAPTVQDAAIFARIDGGRGFNSCFATPRVLIENCDRQLSGSDILLLLRRHLAPLRVIDIINSKEFTDVWSTAI